MLSRPIALGERWIWRTRKTTVTAAFADWKSMVVAVFNVIGRSSGCRNT